MGINRKWLLVFILLGGVVLGLVIGKYYELVTTEAQDNAKELEDLRKSLQGEKDPLKLFSKVARCVTPSVVNISTKKTIMLTQEDSFFPWFYRRLPSERKQIGSGVIVDDQGYILTNNHVVSGAEEIKVTLSDKREFVGKVIGTDKLTDLAVVKINAKNLHHAVLGNSDNLEVGEWVVAIGNPFGLDHTVTSGIISAKRGEIDDLSDYTGFIQTDAAINPGNSGGPLVNLQGEVIGINSAIVSQTGGYQGIGFAIPINRAKSIMNKLIERGKIERPFLGVQLSEINESLAHYYDLPDVAALLKLLKLNEPKGIFIISVVNDSPADKSGLMEGDVVLEFAGKQVNKPNDLTSAISQSKVGDTATIKLIRNGNEVSMKIKVGERE
ncbi:MAG: trypsin-like peptidase domain-containing protein [Planctomycetota bacterium]